MSKFKQKFPYENIEKLNKKFYDETGIRIGSTSQINLYPLMYDRIKNEKFLNLFRFFEINREDIDRNSILFDSEPYECEYVDWFDNISNNFYNTPNLWWVVCLSNSIKNPFEEINNGDQLFIMNNRHLYTLFKQLEKTSDL